MILRARNLGQVARGKLAFSAELRGLGQPSSISRQAASCHTPCAWDLGDARCGIDLNAAERNSAGAVSQVLDSFEFLASGLSGVASGVLTRGKLVWTSGANNALAVEIKAHSSSAGVARIAIALPMGAPVVVGDTFSARAGCARTFATCRDCVANMANFGGFPHMPGTDFAMSYPNQGAGNDGGKIT